MWMMAMWPSLWRLPTLSGFILFANYIKPIRLYRRSHTAVSVCVPNPFWSWNPESSGSNLFTGINYTICFFILAAVILPHIHGHLWLSWLYPPLRPNGTDTLPRRRQLSSPSHRLLRCDTWCLVKNLKKIQIKPPTLNADFVIFDPRRKLENSEKTFFEVFQILKPARPGKSERISRKLLIKPPPVNRPLWPTSSFWIEFELKFHSPTWSDGEIHILVSSKFGRASAKQCFFYAA